MRARILRGVWGHDRIFGRAAGLHATLSAIGATLRVFEEDADDERRDDDDTVIRLSVLRSLQKPIILLMLLGMGAYLCLLLCSAVRTLLSDG